MNEYHSVAGSASQKVLSPFDREVMSLVCEDFSFDRGYDHACRLYRVYTILHPFPNRGHTEAPLTRQNFNRRALVDMEGVGLPPWIGLNRFYNRHVPESLGWPETASTMQSELLVYLEDKASELAGGRRRTVGLHTQARIAAFNSECGQRIAKAA